MFEPGAKVICSFVELYNAFGDKQTVLNMGDRLTVSDTSRIGGSLFLKFVEVPEGNQYFQALAFKPLRSLN